MMRSNKRAGREVNPFIPMILGMGVVALLGCESNTPTRQFECQTEPPPPPGLVVAGSGACLTLIERIAAQYEATYPGARVTVPPSIGTGGAIRALEDGAIDVGLGSRWIREHTRSREIYETLFARVPLVFAVHRSVEEDHFTEEELLAIYEGRRRHWPDDTPIVPLLREPGDSSRELLKETMPRLESAMASAIDKRRFKICYTDIEMAEALVSIPGSIGFLDLGTLRLQKRRVKTFNLFADGTGVLREQDVSKPLTLLTVGKPGGEAARFIAFVQSSAVDELLVEGGYSRPEG